jgi:Flp pilus assembly pilin Flp
MIRKIWSVLRGIWDDERGQDMTEYALVGAFVAAAAMAVSPAVYAVAMYLGQSIRILDVSLAVIAAQ